MDTIVIEYSGLWKWILHSSDILLAEIGISIPYSTFFAFNKLLNCFPVLDDILKVGENTNNNQIVRK